MDPLSTEVAVPEQDTSSPILKTVYVIIGLLGVVGNSLVILVVVKHPSLRSVTNVLISNQTIIDLISTVFFILLYLIPKPQLPPSELAASVLCKLWLSDWPLWGFSVSSTVNLVLLTLERYVAIIHPIKYRNRFSMKLAKCLAVIPWFLGPLHELGWALVHTVDSEGKCNPEWPQNGLQKVLGVMFFIGHYLIPVTLMVYVYTKIQFKLRLDWRSSPPRPSISYSGAAAPSSGYSSSMSNRSARPEPRITFDTQVSAPGTIPRVSLPALPRRFSILASRSVLRTLIIVSAAYIICWGPNEIIYLVYNLGGYVKFHSIYHDLSVIFVLCNMCLNPIIYALHYEEFKRALKATFPCEVHVRWERLMCWRSYSSKNDARRNPPPTVSSTLQSVDTIKV